METHKTILVAGGAGFIGSHLCEHLLGRGNDVICLDNFFTGSKANIVRYQREYFGGDFEAIRHDITQPITIEADRIYNLACPGSPVHYQRYPAKTILTNVVGTANLLALAHEIGARFFQASTSEVYGDPQVHPQPESYWGNVNPIGARSCYDEGKRCAEALAIEYQKQLGTEVRIARIFNIYGPRMPLNDGRVIPNFVTQALKNKPLTVYGTGQQTRSFCYVDDIVKGIVALMEYENVSGPVNLGNPVEVSIVDVARAIIRLTGSKSEIAHADLPEDDPERRCPDPSLAKALIGFEPTIDLEDGLLRTIRDIEERL